ncbi:MAG TPA: aminotransferase class V-fold PLP-dependent enzyme [Coriobacteriia bacterium]
MARTFASDNNSGAHPAALIAITEANDGHVHAYGDDPWTARGVRAVRSHVGEDADVFFVFNGTGANCTGLSEVLRPGDCVVTASTAHIATDECGAPERLTGCKVLTVPTADGKLRPADIEPLLGAIGVEHHTQPKVVSISQVTETGKVYGAKQVRALADLAHANGMYLHMDGARLANAAVALDLPIRAFTTDAGVDILSSGGTKNGMLFGEAVCFLTPGISDRFKYERKSGGQLASKMRYIGAQFAAVYGSSVWHECAASANQKAARLAVGAQAAGVELAWPAQANEIFAIVPTASIPALQAVADFYDWEARGANTVVRWVCSWDTTDEDVDRFLAAIPVATKGH